MITRVAVENLWPGDVLYRTGEPERVGRVESAGLEEALIVFVTPTGVEYREVHRWNDVFVRVRVG